MAAGEVLARAARALSAGPQPFTARPVDADLVADLRAALAPMRRDLDQGRGFAILDEMPGDSDDEIQASFWLAGHALGEPVAQGGAGPFLYDVRDYGQDVAGASFSGTRAESGFHTDSSYGDDVVDTVGLLCLRPAMAGGATHLVDGRAVFDELRASHPEELAVLERPYHVDRRGGGRPGEGPTARHPVLSQDAQRGLTYRYMRLWIEAGHERAAEPLKPAQTRALDALDGILGRPELRVEFVLARRQALFLNNRWILHNRTAFEDHPEPERCRHCVRLWLRAPVG